MQSQCQKQCLKAKRVELLFYLLTESCHVMSNEVEGEGMKEVFDAAGEGSDEEEKEKEVETKSRVRERRREREREEELDARCLHLTSSLFPPVPWTSRQTGMK